MIKFSFNLFDDFQNKVLIKVWSFVFSLKVISWKSNRLIIIMYELIRLLMPLCNQFQTRLAKYKEKKKQCSNSTLKRGWLKNVYSLKNTVIYIKSPVWKVKTRWKMKKSRRWKYYNQKLSALTFQFHDGLPIPKAVLLSVWYEYHKDLH